MFFEEGVVMRSRCWALASVLAAGSVGAVDVPVMNPTATARLEAARAAIADGAWRRAILELQIVVRERTGDADAHNLLGYALRKLEPPQLEQALEHYRTALRLDPGHKGAHEYIGEAYLMRGDLARARHHLAQLERLCGGRDCEEYRDLQAAIDRAVAQGPR